MDLQDELLGDFDPMFRGEGSCVEQGIWSTEDAARFDWLSNKAALVAQGIAIKRGRTWYAHTEKLKAFLLAQARKRAREAIARERRTADEVSVGQGVA
jgi:hypothetical protein